MTHTTNTMMTIMGARYSMYHICIRQYDDDKKIVLDLFKGLLVIQVDSGVRDSNNKKYFEYFVMAALYTKSTVHTL